MASEQAPAFQWYVKDWRSSRKVQRMSFKERGMYREMLDEQWERGTLPGDPASIAALLGGTAKEWNRSWLVLVANFTILSDGRLQNQRLERERDKQRLWRERASKGGSAKATAEAVLKQQVSTATQQPVSSPEAVLPADPKHALHLPLHLHSADCSLPIAGASTPPPPDARSNRLIFRGRRLVVFDWMLDDLLKMLAPHGETFGLDVWFDTLDQRCVDRGEIPPERDNGAWLRSVTLTEAQRRGLPLRVTSAPAQNAVSDDAVWDAIAAAGPSARTLRSLKGGG